MRTLLAALLTLSTTGSGLGHDNLRRNIGSAKMLFCASGSEGGQPNSPIRGQDMEFAVAVFEINNPAGLSGQSISDFVLADDSGTKRPKRVDVVVFKKLPRRHESLGGYYLDPAGPALPWNGTLPKGTIRLHVSAAFGEQYPAKNSARCRVRVGPYLIVGPLNMRWATL